MHARVTAPFHGLSIFPRQSARPAGMMLLENRAMPGYLDTVTAAGGVPLPAVFVALSVAPSHGVSGMMLSSRRSLGGPVRQSPLLGPVDHLPAGEDEVQFPALELYRVFLELHSSELRIAGKRGAIQGGHCGSTEAPNRTTGCTTSARRVSHLFQWSRPGASFPQRTNRSIRSGECVYPRRNR